MNTIFLIQFQKTSNSVLKTFKPVLKNICIIPLSQLSTHCFKGDAIAIKILKDEYIDGLDSCKKNSWNDNAEERIIFSNNSCIEWKVKCFSECS